MPAKPLTPAERDALRRVMTQIWTRLRESGRGVTYALLAEQFGVSAETMRAWFYAKRRVRPEVLRDLARMAGLSATDVFVDANWLDGGEVASPGAAAGGDADLAAGPGWAATRYAAEHAAAVLLRDPTLQDRFTVTLSTLATTGAYPLATDVTAEFRLQPGAQPLPIPEAQQRARLARVDWSPSARLFERDPGFCAVRLELMAAFKNPLRQDGQHTWQGEPDSVTWRGQAATWPAHILVQDIVSGISRAAGADPWQPALPRPLVVIGARFSIGLSAAFIAQALGWQFVVVRSGTAIGRRSDVGAVERDWSSGPAHAWSEASTHIRERHASGAPWRCVLLVRPQSFLDVSGGLDQGALEQLRRSPARIVYARPAQAHLDWWTERQIGLSTGGEYAPAAELWLGRTRAALRGIEEVLDARSAERLDLVRLQPEPPEPFTPHSAALPAELVDSQARFAWDAVTWLGRAERYDGPPLRDRLRPGSLATWRERLIDGSSPAPEYQ